MTIHPYYITIAILLALLFSTIIYLIYASAHSLWPFKNTQKITNTKYSSRFRDINTSQNGNSNVPTGVMVILVILFFAFFIFIIYLAMRANVARYQLASQAIKSGQGGVAAAALAPEIGEGIGDLFGGLRNRY
jgi:hypothetical protein